MTTDYKIGYKKNGCQPVYLSWLPAWNAQV